MAVTVDVGVMVAVNVIVGVRNSVGVRDVVGMDVSVEDLVVDEAIGVNGRWVDGTQADSINKIISANFHLISSLQIRFTSLRAFGKQSHALLRISLLCPILQKSNDIFSQYFISITSLHYNDRGVPE